jgi:hypothetical protein
MSDEWYYWHDTDILGPFTGSRLASLASTGVLLPSDTVWKGDVEDGVPAGSVDSLFPTAATEFSAESTSPSGRAMAGAITEVAGKADQTVRSDSKNAREGATPWFCGPSASKPASKARAVAGKGASIVGQDGSTVKYRKKCTECVHEDSSWKTAAITRGTTRVAYFCPKCRRSHPVEIHGYVS